MEEKFEEVKINNKTQDIMVNSYFDGRVIDYIGWALLLFIITGLSFGIAAPWGKCLFYRYKFNHTVYSGKRLKFEGTGGDLFVNELIWFLLTCITFGIYGWWVPAKKANWVISNLHFEDEEYIEENSYFEDKSIKLFWLNIVWKFLNIISFGLLIPFTMSMKLKYLNKKTVINNKKLIFDGHGISLLGYYILWGILTFITFGIYGLWVPVKMLKWQVEYTHIKENDEEEDTSDKSVLIIIPIFFIGLAILIGLIVLFTTIFSGFTINNIFRYPIDDTINGWKYCEKGYAYKDKEYIGPQCYKYDSDISKKECIKEKGKYNNYSNYGLSCLIEKDPLKLPEDSRIDNIE